jgi:succinyl-CoA synthetase beta subunit
MKIHEYQAKDLFQRYSIPVPKGFVARRDSEAFEAAVAIGSGPYVLKAQIHAGGRGKGGGIRVAGTGGEAKDVAASMLGSRLVTPQTGSEGRPVNSLLVEELLEVGREIYLGVAIDRPAERVVVLASGEGGMEIEKVALEMPDKVLAEPVHPAVGLRAFQAQRIAYWLGMEPGLTRQAAAIVMQLYRLFTDLDCSLAEINPLVVTHDRGLVALDGKINLDDNALFRHRDIADWRDEAQENGLEVEASRHNLNYIKLQGNVGCMVNGAGLAMATMDLIKLAGASPANFLDVGGGATAGMVSEGLKILLTDGDVKVILINIFGGILRCDTLAQGVVDAARVLRIGIPMVIRLEGTNVEMGRQILARSGLSFTVATGMADAAAKVTGALESLR